MKKIQNGDTVTLNYTGKLEDGTMFDSSLVPGRTPLKATIGQGLFIKGFENALLDMTKGESKTVEILPEDAYGMNTPEMIMEIPKSAVPMNVEVGQMLQGSSPNGPMNVKVLEVKEETIVIDANHPLAGKKLIFELEVLEVE